MRHAHHRDEPRRPVEVHPIDCSCCGNDDSALDWNGVALRVLLGLGLGTAAALTLSAFSGVPVL
ncbi:hypothetical protein [Sphingomonas sp.]|uniref:hypothetical protein n=1 Tax=Sphingomonas sp. TaxID=28214 RepID=UPI003F6E68AD